MEAFLSQRAFCSDLDLGKSYSDKVHISLKPFKGKKTITIIEGLDEELDLKAICKALKKPDKKLKRAGCNGSVKQTDDTEKFLIELSGDQRVAAMKFLVSEEIYELDQIIVHGV